MWLNSTQSTCRNGFYSLIFGFFMVLCFSGIICVDNALATNSSALKSLTVTYRDGESIEVTRPAIRYIVNPGYVPTRELTCDFIEMVKKETVRNVTTSKKKVINLTDIASIELETEDSWYYWVITLLDGKKLVSKGRFLWVPDNNKTSEEYRGYNYKLYEESRNPRLVGSVLSNVTAGSFSTMFFPGPIPSPDDIRKIVFNY